DLLPPPHFRIDETVQEELNGWLQSQNLHKHEAWIGLAPFAMHATKIWPGENFAAVIDSLLRKTSVKFFLFGGGDSEIRYFKELQNQFPDSCIIVAGQLSLPQEIA